MKGNWAVKIMSFLAFLVVVAAVMSFFVMRLWNRLMPNVFGLHAISYWQALGIFILSKILFTSFRGRPAGSGGWRERRLRKFAQMTPEERERFRAGMMDRCGGIAPPASDVKT